MSFIVVVLCGGFGNRFKTSGTPVKKPLINVHGHSQLFWSIKSTLLTYAPDKIILGVRSDLIADVGLEIEFLNDLGVQVEIVNVGASTNGPAETTARTLVGSKKLSSKDAIIVADNDCFNLFDNSVNLLFPFVSITESKNPAHCFVEITSNLQVQSFHEKQIVGKYAVSGNYGFKNQSQFFESYEKNRGKQREYYLSDIMTDVLKVCPVNVVKTREYFSFGTPEEIANVGSKILSYL